MASLSFHAILVSLSLLLHMIIKLIIARSRRSNDQKTSSLLPPGPSPWPILGSLPEMWRDGSATSWVCGVMDDHNTDIACIRLGNSYVIPVRSPELAKEFLKKHDAVCASRPETMATRILSRGYRTAVVGPLGEQWKKMRKAVACEVFNPANLQWLLHKRNLEADNLVRYIYSYCSDTSEGGLVDVRTASRQYSSGVMRRMIFDKRHFGKGRENGGPGSEEEEYVEALFTIIGHVYSFSVSDCLPWLECLDLDGHKKTILQAIQVIRKYEDPIVTDRIRRRRNCGPQSKPEDLLDVFISLKDSTGNPLLSDDEIRSQVTELFFTVDNPYNVTEWTLSELLNDPEMMKKAVDELDRVVGKDRLLEESDIPKLQYLTACAREVFRLHPVSHFNLPHTSTTDITVGGYFIPKGSSVFLNRTGLGRNPELWKDPLRFDPGRHLKEGHFVDLTVDDFRFVTFSGGRRKCTNIGLGTNMIMMLLGRILQGFSWEIPHGLDKINLSEGGKSDLFKSQPLIALAKPRLNACVYQSLRY